MGLGQETDGSDLFSKGHFHYLCLHCHGQAKAEAKRLRPQQPSCALILQLLHLLVPSWGVHVTMATSGQTFLALKDAYICIKVIHHSCGFVMMCRRILLHQVLPTQLEVCLDLKLSWFLSRGGITLCREGQSSGLKTLLLLVPGRMSASDRTAQSMALG